MSNKTLPMNIIVVLQSNMDSLSGVIATVAKMGGEGEVQEGSVPDIGVGFSS